MKSRIAASITAAILVIVASTLFMPVSPRLLVTTQNGDTVFCLPLEDGEEFSIRYKHSVNLSDVEDVIERDGGSLVVRRSIYSQFGAGIPTSDVGSSLTMCEDGRLMLDGIDAYHDEFLLFTGTIANHRLLYRGHEFALKAYAGEQTLLKFRIQRVSLLKILLYGGKI